MRIELYNHTKKTEWDDFIGNSINPMFMFFRDYMDYHKDRFQDHSLMVYDDSNKLCAVMPASIKNDVLSSHGGLTFGGFVVNKKMKQKTMCEIFDLLKVYMVDQGIYTLIYKAVPHIYHLQPAEEDLYAICQAGGEIEKVECSTVINLRDRIKLATDRRQHISKAKKEGVIVEESDDFDGFINLENEVLSTYHQTKAVHSGEELKLLHDRFPENIKLYVGMYNGKMIAGSVIFIYANVVHSQYMASFGMGRKIGALDLVVSTLLETYKDKIWYDFGISTEDKGKVLNEGLIAQKEGFGGRTFVYQTWRLDVNRM